MGKRIEISTGTPWERSFGYVRAVRVGNLIEVSGTVAADADGNVIGDTVYDQTQYILRKIEAALVEAGGGLSDVIKTRWYLTDIRDIAEAGRAHAEVFRAIRPAALALQVAALVNPEMLIEIEATAVLDQP